MPYHIGPKLSARRRALPSLRKFLPVSQLLPNSIRPRALLPCDVHPRVRLPLHAPCPCVQGPPDVHRLMWPPRAASTSPLRVSQPAPERVPTRPRASTRSRWTSFAPSAINRSPPSRQQHRHLLRTSRTLPFERKDSLIARAQRGCVRFRRVSNALFGLPEYGLLLLSNHQGRSRLALKFRCSCHRQLARLLQLLRAPFRILHGSIHPSQPFSPSRSLRKAFNRSSALSAR